MKDWIAILWEGLAGLAARRNVPSQRGGRAEPVDRDASAGKSPGERPPETAIEPDVPNTRIPPLPEHTPVAILEFEGPPGPVPIKHGDTVIGRHSEDDVRISDVRISRHHARLRAGSERCEISNLTALRPDPNPMFVNGTYREHAEVVDGDVISLGGVSFTFRKARNGD